MEIKNAVENASYDWRNARFNDLNRIWGFLEMFLYIIIGMN